MKLLILLAILFTRSSEDGNIKNAHFTHGLKSEGKVEFVVDYSRFLRSDSITVFEFSYLLNLNSLKRKDGRLEFKAKVEINGKSLTSPIVTEWTQRTDKPLSYSIDKFWASLAQGEYDVKFTISDLNSRNSGKAVFKVRSLEKDTILQGSDLQLLLSMYPGEDSVFGRFGYVQIPNPSATYSGGRDTLFFYMELYNLSADTVPYFVRYFILDEHGSLLRATNPIVRERSEFPLIRDGILLEGLKGGKYTIRVQVVDPATGRSVEEERDFLYVASEPVSGEISTEDISYFYFIDYYASPSELREFQSLPEDGKVLYLKKFWKRFDPTPDTDYNEFFVEFTKRCRYADENFSLPEKSGRLTDRGRIYIKYGQPDERNRVTFELTSRNREHWIYYSGGLKEFVFVDIKNTGDFELVYSTESDEPSKPDWTRYVSPADLQKRSFQE